MEKGAMNLKKSKEGYIGGLAGREEKREKLCNYNLKNKIKT